MTERPYIWHASKFDPDLELNYPWAVSLGRPNHIADHVEGAVFETPAQAMNHAITLVPKEVP